MSENFGLDDYLTEDAGGKRNIVRGATWLFCGAVLIFSAITTYMFFSTYAGAVGAFVQDEYLAPIVAGIIGVILLDVGTLMWALARAYFVI